MIVAIACLEGLLLLGYGVAIVISSFSDTSRGIVGATSSPYALLLVYVLIAAVMVVIARGLWSGNTSARSAYVLSQGFSIVISQTLFAGSQEWERVLALGLIAAAIVSGVALLSKPVRDTFV
jgi:hypothetical protein